MERLTGNVKPSGITAAALRVWGCLFLALGVVGKGLIQNVLLGIGARDMQDIFQAMNESGEVMGMVTLSLVLQAVESCAVPIFAFLTVEGYQHTSDHKKYLVRVILVALVSELLYNIVMDGKVISLYSRNPVWGVVLALVLLRLFRYADDRLKGSKILKIVMGLAGILWAKMLGVEHGVFFVIMVLVLWIMRSKPQFRLFVGMGAAAMCTAISPFYLASTMGFMAVHFFNGEKGDSSPIVNYGAYPAMLLAVAAASFFF